MRGLDWRLWVFYYGAVLSIVPLIVGMSLILVRTPVAGLATAVLALPSIAIGTALLFNLHDSFTFVANRYYGEKLTRFLSWMLRFQAGALLLVGALICGAGIGRLT